jgi:hypothetical protein
MYNKKHKNLLGGVGQNTNLTFSFVYGLRNPLNTVKILGSPSDVTKKKIFYFDIATPTNESAVP